MKNRLVEIDVLRALSCLAVIIIHTSAGPVSTLQPGSIHLYTMILINSAFRAAVPGFIFLSGFSLTYAYQNKDLSKSEVWNRKFAKILLSYLAWSLVYYFISIRLGYYKFSWSFLIKKLSLGDMFYHLYFVVLICQFYLLFKPIRLIFRRFNPGLVLLIMFLINVIFIGLIYFRYIDRFFLQYLFFFGLGCYGAIKMGEVKKIVAGSEKYLTILYIAAVLYYTYRFYQSYILKLPIKNINLLWFMFCIVSILFFYYLSLRISQMHRLVRLLKSISISSFCIYLSHPLFLFCSQIMLDRWGYVSITKNFLINTCVVFFTAIPLSLLYTAVKHKFFKQISKKYSYSLSSEGSVNDEA